MQTRIPTKPKINRKYTLTQQEIDCLNYYCVFQCAKTDAFKAFIAPELAISKLKLKQATEQFFAMSEVKDYIFEYTKTLDEFFGKERLETKDNSRPLSAEERNEIVNLFIDDTLKIVLKSIQSGDEINREEFIKLIDRANLLKAEEVQVEQPRRYLPETCHSSCRYRAFCEQECDDLCRYCKYKKFGEENGVHYESEKQLEIPNNEG